MRVAVFMKLLSTGADRSLQHIQSIYNIQFYELFQLVLEFFSSILSLCSINQKWNKIPSQRAQRLPFCAVYDQTSVLGVFDPPQRHGEDKNDEKVTI